MDATVHFTPKNKEIETFNKLKGVEYCLSVTKYYLNDIKNECILTINYDGKETSDFCQTLTDYNFHSMGRTLSIEEVVVCTAKVEAFSIPTSTVIFRYEEV